MILATRGGGALRVESRDANVNAFQPRVPSPGHAGVGGTDEIVGLPAVLSAGRLISETIASMGQCVYRHGKDGSKEEARDTWQYELLEHSPNELMGAFQVTAHKVWSLLFYGNAFELKAKAGGQVRELWPLDPNAVTIRREGMGLVYDVRTSKGSVRLTRDDLVHTVGLTGSDPYMGVSIIEFAGGALRKQLHAETYARRFFENDATPGGLLTTTGRLTREQRSELRDSWQSRHMGAGNAGKLAVLDSGATYQPVGVSPRDAQFVETARFNVQEIARIMGLWSGWLGDTEAQMASSLEQENSRLLNVSLNPWIKRILAAQKSDRDLFPASDLRPVFDTDEFVRADTKTRHEAYLIARQAGWMSVNDIRGEEGMGPIAGGDLYQETPVGGAPNLQPQGGSDAAA